MRTPCCLARNHRFTFRTSLCRSAKACARYEHIHRLHDKKEYGRSHQYKRNDGIHEMTVLKFRTVDSKDKPAEIRHASDSRDERREEIRDKRVYDTRKCGADDDAHREVDNAAAQKELLELL